ncbi:hypothetical protein ACFP63_19680 [Oerskovia jenensis]|uniref:Asp23/Gls24 family envelope stress response protein n=1 Tax=Oerskovia jenensis TaxID=162169 RepID=A0ABS2LKR1_9CELL|nr:hypothetical protein [Oerskovia jenensis]MBM7481005.1 hypothetical protein [Oerskovia jenensis]
MTTSVPAASDPGPTGQGEEDAVPTPLDVAEAFEHAHAAASDVEPSAPGPVPGPVAVDATAAATGPVAGTGAQTVTADRDQDELADRVVARVLAVPGVVRLHAGVFGEVATYLPGRAVTGVRLRPEETEVHLVVSVGRPLPDVARDVHEALRGLVPGPVRVFVEDVESPPSSPSAP